MLIVQIHKIVIEKRYPPLPLDLGLNGEKRSVYGRFF